MAGFGTSPDVVDVPPGTGGNDPLIHFYPQAVVEKRWAQPGDVSWCGMVKQTPTVIHNHKCPSCIVCAEEYNKRLAEIRRRYGR